MKKGKHGKSLLANILYVPPLTPPFANNGLGDHRAVVGEELESGAGR